MSNAVVYGSEDLTTRTTTLAGTLTLNGVDVSLVSDTVDSVVSMINRFTTLTHVTASVAAADSSAVVAKSSHPQKHLVLTSQEDMSIGGDTALLSELGLVGGVTKVSTAGVHATKVST